ncbi:MAG: hypothetical protein JOZ08_18415 [Verrucomicrobia bacterium]|nr:hypothetical protein [Verrucomicrobiota bacterium]MBV8279601.1 hypothetical protein [Verrucomicrobiota bacterium]
MSGEKPLFPSTEEIVNRVAAINRASGNSVALENIEVLVNPDTGDFVTISVGEPSEITGIRMSDGTHGCDDCGAHEWNGEDLPLVFRSGNWFCPNCYEAARSPEEPGCKEILGFAC